MALALLLLAACYTTMPAPPPPHAASATITLTADGPVPSPDVHLPGFAVVVFRNQTGAPLAITIDRPLGVCVNCETALGFAAHDHRSRAELSSGGVVSLCFHDPGSFAWHAEGGTHHSAGTVHVEGRR